MNSSELLTTVLLVGFGVLVITGILTAEENHTFTPFFKMLNGE